MILVLARSTFHNVHFSGSDSSDHSCGQLGTISMVQYYGHRMGPSPVQGTAKPNNTTVSSAHRQRQVNA